MPNNAIKGFTLVELILVMGMLVVLLGVSIVAIKPQERLAKSRDSKRLDDMLMLSTAIEEYKVDNGVYPGSNSVLYQSQNLTNGIWINSDLSAYVASQPVDPKNDDVYNLRYQRVDEDYELDVVLEYMVENAINDTGNNSLRYEVGTNLSILN